MRWVAKALLQRSFSHIPYGERANYAFQRRVTRSLPASDEQFMSRAKAAIDHLSQFRAHGGLTDIGAVRFYEFGAGWSLASPVVFFGLGVNDQTVIDVEPHLRLDLVEHSISQYRRRKRDLEAMAGVELRPIDNSPLRSPGDLQKLLGITYRAPCDARRTGLAGECFDFASSTSTLEHIPAEDVADILAETERLLMPGGIVSSLIDLKDHYASFDGSICAYNFLKFSDWAWRPLNPRLHFQNRLRAPDYARLFRAAGLDIVEQWAEEPSPEDLQQLTGMPLAERFRGYSLAELAVPLVRITAAKR